MPAKKIIEPVGSTPEAYGRVIIRENELMAKAGKAASLKSD